MKQSMNVSYHTVFVLTLPDDNILSMLHTFLRHNSFSNV